jgi:hypothetical protein
VHVRSCLAALLLVATICAAGPALAQMTPVMTAEHADQTSQPDVPCASLEEPERRRTERCKTDEEQRADDLERRRKERAERERPSRTSLLRWLHTDAMWTQSSTGGSMYGVVGVHLVVANVGRLHFFGPPGVMLVTEPSSGGRMWRGKLTWGIGIHLVDFRPPGTHREARLFVNLAKAWSGSNFQTGSDMVGLSVTWKK